MITKQILQPQSIVVVGASNNVQKPGGAILKNLILGGYKGELRAVNPKETEVQGITAHANVRDIPDTDLAILAIAAPLCPEAVEVLAGSKQTRAFIILSAGFGEETREGALLEQQILDTVNKYGAALIGPNCIGLLNTWHHSVFTQPIPSLDPQGVDLISGSGATAVFILESAMLKGLQFNSVWSVGNARQIGVEDVLQHMDETFNPKTDSTIKLIYMESIRNPDRLLFHASSLIRKGCKIAAIKAGSSESGSRAATSHTGAIAGSDAAVEALFRKAGIIRCYSREELATVGCIFTLPELKGRNFAIVTHAGGPGVMLTDALSKGGLNVPEPEPAIAAELKAKLLPGASVNNPIDILATGSPEHLGTVIDYCENKFANIDAILAIFGTPGLVTMFDMYEVLHRKMLDGKKPIFPVLPSISTAGKEVAGFLKKGHVNFADEVTLGTALSRIMNAPRPATHEIELFGVDIPRIRRIIDSIPEDGYIAPNHVQDLLRSAGIPIVDEYVSGTKNEILAFAQRIGYPVVVKAVGPVHKSDVDGVTLNITGKQHLALEFDRMMQIPGTSAVMVQPMLKGTELFVGAKYEETFGHVVLCGLGGIFVEVLKDISSGLAPLSYEEARSMIRSLRAYRIIQGTRGRKGVNENKFAEIIVRLSTLLRFATEIKEMDINPLLATEKEVIAVDARIRIEKELTIDN
ncbi:MAG: acetate--CoA ligase family protein [Mediterranea sp.]|jgi:acetyltransferase|nr:acetate--CoA ligase family protein [Mediterranea sp.]